MVTVTYLSILDIICKRSTTMAPIRRRRRNKQRINQYAKKKVPVSSVKILDLNEHCMLEIFNYLSPLDMCAVKDTCVRLREVAESHMETIYKSKELVLTSRTKGAYRVLRKFGAVLRKLNIEGTNSYQRNEETISAIRKLNPNLTSLTLADTNFELALSRLRPLLGNLKKIKLEYCYNDFRCDIGREETIKNFYRACTNVEELSFGAKVSALGSCYQGIFLQLKFKHLRSLELYEVRDLDLNNVKLFLKFNPNIRKLSLKCCVSLDQLSDFNLMQYARQIEGLSLKFNETDHTTHQNTHLRLTNDLTQLDNLNCLALDTCHADITKVIAAMAKRNSLVHLSLTNVTLKINEGLGKAFANMSNLKVLRLHIIIYFLTGGDMFKVLCKNLVNLEELFLLKSNLNFQHIGDIIENAVNLKRLYLPSLEHIWNGQLDEDRYLDYVEMQSRKNRNFPLTIYFEKNSTFPIAMKSIPRDAIVLHRDVLNVSKFNPSEFDDYQLPHHAVL